jgi:hypothetical protein
LFLGTLSDNNADRVRKGRNADAKGVKNSNAKLTEAQVLAVRASNATGTFLAAKYGVTKEMISQIKRRKTWKHI